jgi:murein L,D-transpeptidase YcbB/YkuD
MTTLAYDPPPAQYNFETALVQIRFNKLRSYRLLDYLDAWGSHAIDGFYDFAMVLNVAKFQQLYGLRADGIYGPITQAKLTDAELYYHITY